MLLLHYTLQFLSMERNYCNHINILATNLYYANNYRTNAINSSKSNDMDVNIRTDISTVLSDKIFLFEIPGSRGTRIFRFNHSSNEYSWTSELITDLDNL